MALISFIVFWGRRGGGGGYKMTLENQYRLRIRQKAPSSFIIQFQKPSVTRTPAWSYQNSVAFSAWKTRNVQPEMCTPNMKLNCMGPRWYSWPAGFYAGSSLRCFEWRLSILCFQLVVECVVHVTTVENAYGATFHGATVAVLFWRKEQLLSMVVPSAKRVPEVITQEKKK